jgi:aminopeptidase N
VAGNGAADALSALQDFDGISYVKGASILRQLNATIGDEAFFSGVVDHFTRHRFGNAPMHDLFQSWQRSTDSDLSAFTGAWLRTAGPDVFEQDRGRGVLRRTPPGAHPADRPHRFRITGAVAVAWSAVDVEVTGPETPFDSGADAVVIDAEEASWGVYVPDATTVARLVGLLPEAKDERLRAGIWNNVRSGFHHGSVDPASVVELLVAGLPIEDTEDTRRHLMPWVLGWVLPAAPPGSGERIHDAALGRLAECAPGSELQLSAFRAAVHTCAAAHLLRRWLGAPPEGIDRDVDVRWRLLVRLAVLGGTDRA